jgi:branched-subunit amino acid ABC-type transport system permease component
VAGRGDRIVSIFVASVGFGLITAAVLAIAAVGFTLQFAVTNVLNLAFAAIMTAGAFVAYWINQAGVSVWLALIVAMAVCSALSVLLNLAVYAPFQRRGSSPITIVIVSLGMALIIEFGIQAVVGGVNVSYTMGQGTTFRAGGLILTTVQLVIIAVSLVVMAAVHVLLRYTKLGKAMRATAANRSLARNCGIRTSRVITVTWALTGALGGLAGTIFAIDIGSFGPTSTDLFVVLIGLATEVSAAYIQPDYKYVIAFVVLLAMLAVRPSGLFGARA